MLVFNTCSCQSSLLCFYPDILVCIGVLYVSYTVSYYLMRNSDNGVCYVKTKQKNLYYIMQNIQSCFIKS